MKPSLRPSKTPESAPPESQRFIDSGARYFMRGRYYYRQMGDLAINLSGAKTVSDDDWREYLTGSLAIARELGRGPKVCLIAFAGAHLNAGQRRMSAEFIAKEQVRPIERVAILTDNNALRAAMTAFSWLMPSLKYRPFRASDAAGACAWLLEVGRFDETTALSAWAEACSALGDAL